MSITPSDREPEQDASTPVNGPSWTKEPHVPAQGFPPPQEQQGFPGQQGYPGQQTYPGRQGYPGGPGGPWAPQDPYAKSRMAAGLFGIFLGALGVHRFYLGYTGLGLTMVLLTVLSFGFLSPLVAIWGLVEGILYLTDKTGSYSRDATGRPLRD